MGDLPKLPVRIDGMAGYITGELELDCYPLCSRGYHPDVPLELEEGEEVSEGVWGGVQEEAICHAAGADMIVRPISLSLVGN